MASKDYASPWLNQSAPDVDQILAIAHYLKDRLPEPLRGRTQNVVLNVIEFPSEELGDDLALETPFDLLGLFEGQGQAEYWTPRSASAQPTLTLFRRAILDHWADSEEPMGEIILHILANELGHHFGLEEDEIASIQEAAW